MKINQTEEGLLVIEYGNVNRMLDKLAVFDLDLTLIGKGVDMFSIEWEYLYPEVPTRIRELSKQGYFIGMASNQSQLIQCGAIDNFTRKVSSILADLDVPAVFLAALRKNKYRKPSIGMYEYFCEKYLNESSIVEKIFIGDAVDCSFGPGHTNSCDNKFAYNSKMEFKHPEEFFRGTPGSYFFKPLNLDKYRERGFEIDGTKDIVFVFGKKKCCGKRFFIRKYFPQHTVVKENEFKHSSGPCVLVNCNDSLFIRKCVDKFPNRCSIYYLDYPDEIMNYLKTLAVLCGESSDDTFVPIEPTTFETVETFGFKVPFIFDDSGFGEEKLKLSRMQL